MLLLAHVPSFPSSWSLIVPALSCLLLQSVVQLFPKSKESNTQFLSVFDNMEMRILWPSHISLKSLQVTHDRAISCRRARVSGCWLNNHLLARYTVSDERDRRMLHRSAPTHPNCHWEQWGKESMPQKHLFYCYFIYTVKITLSTSHHLQALKP